MAIKTVAVVSNALRAILAEWARRVWWGVASLTWLVLGVLLVAAILATWFHSAWWGIAVVIIAVVSLVLTVALLLARGAIGLAGRSKYAAAQREHTGRIVDKITMLSDVKSLPRPLLGIRVVFDLAFNRTNYLRGLLEASTTLKTDFAELMAVMTPSGDAGSSPA
ncbi:MAG: hypothetical protein LBR58_03535 [Propionibacteriaceae bacterium]|jgi:hypothetical protein|nr:hypothetical protein [Propionibacteriaceae bacterium]